MPRLRQVRRSVGICVVRPKLPNRRLNYRIGRHWRNSHCAMKLVPLSHFMRYISTGPFSVTRPAPTEPEQPNRFASRSTVAEDIPGRKSTVCTTTSPASSLTLICPGAKVVREGAAEAAEVLADCFGADCSMAQHWAFISSRNLMPVVEQPARANSAVATHSVWMFFIQISPCICEPDNDARHVLTNMPELFFPRVYLASPSGNVAQCIP